VERILFVVLVHRELVPTHELPHQGLWGLHTSGLSLCSAIHPHPNCVAPGPAIQLLHATRG
jgi:hypothetical protein